MCEPSGVRSARLVIGEMAVQVEQWQVCGDRRGIFLDCYLRMTRNMLAALDDAEFQDSGWVDRLLGRFAGYYFDALHAYEQASPTTPAVWRVAHDAARQPHTMTLQNLFLGVNAHINYDLVLTLVELLGSEWSSLSEEERQRYYADYTHVNDVIARTIDAVQDEIVESATPALRVVDDLLGPLDEWATERIIVEWRDEVWQHAVAMLDTQDANLRERQRQAVESATIRRAEWVLGRMGR
jgi:hypothetical protein